jgi:hypothetical protein
VFFTAIQQLLAGQKLKEFKELEGRLVRSLPSGGFKRISVVERNRNLDTDPSTIGRVGRVVVRHLLEPRRDGREVHFKDPNASQRVALELNPLQGILEVRNPIFSLNWISRKRLNSAFAGESKITAPFTFDVELRKQLTRGPTDDASPPGILENIAEMATDKVSSVSSPCRVKRW